VYEVDYYPFNDRLVPLRWMPPEAVLDDRYSSASDAWSYGVFVFELFSGGAQPYADKTNEEILLGMSTTEGNCLHRPQACPEVLWRLSQQCLRARPEDRVEFSEIEVVTGGTIADSCI